MTQHVSIVIIMNVVLILLYVQRNEIIENHSDMFENSLNPGLNKY